VWESGIHFPTPQRLVVYFLHVDILYKYNLMNETEIKCQNLFLPEKKNKEDIISCPF